MAYKNKNDFKNCRVKKDAKPTNLLDEGTLRDYISHFFSAWGRMTFQSASYWEKRYSKGGNSGVGSYGRLALYKAQIINSFVKENGIRSVVEFGCGDGNQLSYYEAPEYIGVDVSKTAIEMCKVKFNGDRSKRFLLYDEFVSGDFEPAELTLSVDVIYHLIEHEVFSRHIRDLFRYSGRYAIIYSTNFDRVYRSPHQVDRRFTHWIEQNTRDFKLVETIQNPFKGEDTMSDFYIYRRAG